MLLNKSGNDWQTKQQIAHRASLLLSRRTEIDQTLSNLIARDAFALVATNVRRIRNATIAMLIANAASGSGAFFRTHRPGKPICQDVRDSE